MVTSLQEAHQIITAQSETIASYGETVATLQGQVETLDGALKKELATVQRLQQQLEQYVKRVYGHSSERYCPEQILFDPLLLASLPDGSRVEAAAVEPQEAPPSSPRRRKYTPHGRLPIPEHLERVVIELDVDACQRLCPRTGAEMVVIGYEESEKLEYRPGRLFVNVYRRPKYASPDRIKGNGMGIVTAPMPDHPIAKCKADVGLIAYAIVSKFADHLPFYRQDAIFEREGVAVARSTLDGWALGTADTLRPLGEALKQAVLDTDVLFTDDSVIPLLERGRGKTRKARLWVYVRGDPGPSLATYDFTRDRRNIRPLEYLGDYQGYIHADAYSGYDELFTKDGIVEVACWCHARRGFDEAMTSRPREASEILALIGRFYKVERTLREMSPEQRRQQRQQTVRLIVDAVFERVEDMKTSTLPTEPLRKAIGYVENQRLALRRFLDDGRLEADNNTAENAIRPLAIGRKNWLFAGSERGGQAAALYLGLIQSCKACDVNPWAYFDDILRRIMAHPVSQLRQLLPDQWRPLERDTQGLILQS
jgi:transposase